MRRGSLKMVSGSELMSRRARTFAVLFAVACVMCPELGVSAPDTVTRVEIGEGQIGAPPAEFELSPWGEGKQTWKVVRDGTAKAGIAIEQAGVQSGEYRSPLAIYKPASFRNAEISLRLNAIGGKSNQGGGLAVRLRSPRDYYLVQIDALRTRVL